MTFGGIKRYFIFKFLLAVLLIAVMVLTFFAKQYAFFPFDLYLTLEIQKVDAGWFTGLMRGLSWLGNEMQAVVSLIVGCGLFLFLRKKAYAAGLFISTVGAVLISEIIKIIVARPRPDPTIIYQLETFIRADSFPSGHVLFYIGFYGFLFFAAFTLIKNIFLRNALCIVLGFMVGLIGISRIYIGSHWFSDTIASYLIGVIWLYFMVLIFRRIEVVLSDK